MRSISASFYKNQILALFQKVLFPKQKLVFFFQRIVFFFEFLHLFVVIAIDHSKPFDF